MTTEMNPAHPTRRAQTPSEALLGDIRSAHLTTSVPEAPAAGAPEMTPEQRVEARRERNRVAARERARKRREHARAEQGHPPVRAPRITAATPEAEPTRQPAERSESAYLRAENTRLWRLIEYFMAREGATPPH
jgi:hypothetical protein